MVVGEFLTFSWPQDDRNYFILEWSICHHYLTHQKIEMEVTIFLLTHPTAQHHSINVLINSSIIWSPQIIQFVSVKHHVLLRGKSIQRSNVTGSILTDHIIFNLKILGIQKSSLHWFYHLNPPLILWVGNIIERRYMSKIILLNWMFISKPSIMRLLNKRRRTKVKNDFFS